MPTSPSGGTIASSRLACAEVRSPVRGLIQCAVPCGGSASLTGSPIVLYTINPPARVLAAIVIVQFCPKHPSFSL